MKLTNEEIKQIVDKAIQTAPRANHGMSVTIAGMFDQITYAAKNGYTIEMFKQHLAQANGKTITLHRIDMPYAEDMDLITRSEMTVYGATFTAIRVG